MRQTSPDDTVGVVGGGQLGRMLGEAAGPLGIDLVVSDPTPEAPASAVVREQLVGDFDDEATVRELAERADYLTYEIELTDPDVLERASSATGTPVHPAPETLRTIQDKLRQKRHLADAGVPVPAFTAVDSPADIRAAGDTFGYPMMLKARTGGYDGRGNVPVASPEDVEPADATIDGPAMVEEFVDFERELAVIGCVGVDEVDAFPVTETVHEEEILRETVSPARAPTTVRERATAVARDVLSVLEGRGVYGIELFETREGEILLNEIAPRPHNSGHWTIEGCHTSQFDQHLRAVTGRPLGCTERRSPTVTANVLGDVADRQAAQLDGVASLLAADRCALHWYGKREVYELRKMGHFTLVGADSSEDPEVAVESLLDRARSLRSELTFQDR